MASEDIAELVAKELRRQIELGRQQEALPAVEAAQFDPVMKIASILSRTKISSLLRYFHDAVYASVISGNERTSRYSWEWREPTIADLRRPFYEAADFLLFEYLGSGLRRPNRNGRILMDIIAKAGSSREALYKIALMRVRQSYLFSKDEAFRPEQDSDSLLGMRRRRTRQRSRITEGDDAQHRKLQPSKEWLAAEVAEAQKPLEKLADDVAWALYEKFAIEFYHRNFGLPTTQVLKARSFHVKEKPEAYQDTLQGLLPLDPKAVMAANAYCTNFPGFEERLKRSSTAFHLVLLAAIDFYQSRIAEPELKHAISSAVNGTRDLQSVFYLTIFASHLSWAGKIK
ncbi:hypothetical protein HYU17_02150 [Candidatus Woesearchaeota archaeon]|nr:hypothetical protein [Candidatus Woesearchaeota archaeon]